MFYTDISVPSPTHPWFEGQPTLQLDCRIPKSLTDAYLAETFPGVPVEVRDFGEDMNV